MKCVYLLLLVALLAVPALSDQVIVGLSGPEDGAALIDMNQAWAVAWSQGRGFSSVHIFANLVDDSFGLAGGQAYLLNSIGYGTSTYNEIARAEFTADSFQSSWVDLFGEDLSLPVGTYFLVLAPLQFPDGNSDTRMLWNTTFSPAVTTDPDVWQGDITGDVQWYATQTFDPDYLPASTFNASQLTTDGNLLFEVTSVPEPSSMWLLLAGITMLACFRRRRRTGPGCSRCRRGAPG